MRILLVEPFGHREGHFSGYPNYVSRALADAGIPMRDLVVACAAGKAGGKIALDLMDTEDKVGEADVPVAYMPNLDAITLLQMDGNMSTDELETAVTMAVDGCKKLYEVQKEALKAKYVVEEETEQ